MGYSQNNSFESFFKPSDSLNLKRQNTVIISEAVLAAGTLIGLVKLGTLIIPNQISIL